MGLVDLVRRKFGRKEEKNSKTISFRRIAKGVVGGLIASILAWPALEIMNNSRSRAFSIHPKLEFSTEQRFRRNYKISDAEDTRTAMRRRIAETLNIYTGGLIFSEELHKLKFILTDAHPYFIVPDFREEGMTDNKNKGLYYPVGNQILLRSISDERTIIHEIFGHHRFSERYTNEQKKMIQTYLDCYNAKCKEFSAQIDRSGEFSSASFGESQGFITKGEWDDDEEFFSLITGKYYCGLEITPSEQNAGELYLGYLRGYEIFKIFFDPLFKELNGTLMNDRRSICLGDVNMQTMFSAKDYFPGLVSNLQRLTNLPFIIKE